MKLITDVKNLKVDYVYDLKDNNGSMMGLILSNNNAAARCKILSGISIEGVFTTYSETISQYKETDDKFDGILNYAFYEMGHKDEFPEYFL